MSCPEIKRVLMNNPNADQMRHCFESLRRMLSRSENPPIDEVIKEGLLDACIQALQINVCGRFEHLYRISSNYI